MPRVLFYYRFVIDRSFFDEVMIAFGQPNNKAFHQLMTISVNSQEFKKEHNLISEKITRTSS